MSGGVPSVVELAELLSVPVCTTYLHNDAFPASHKLSLGPLGYQVRGPQRCLELDRCTPKELPANIFCEDGSWRFSCSKASKISKPFH